MTEQELDRIYNTYRTAQHLIMGHIYRDIMKLLEEVIRLRKILDEKAES